ncbi:hypothetical protein E2C01_022251 [Portunus trituberculatus]|uniref:Uncharacterized protein n=1 Tax=Portunus trituberculatus TaxID=210409 RepID=A0A5B7E6S3_PORTR|nr:hypothetical protein [Portunus trituberculatus]
MREGQSMDQEGKVKWVEPEGLVFEVVELIKGKLKLPSGVELPDKNYMVRISKESNLEAKDDNGDTPFHVAVLKEALEALDTLLDW